MKAFWAVIGGVGAIYLLWPAGAPDTPLDAPVAPDRAVAPKAPAPSPPAAGVTLDRAADGHFYADAMVNGTPVRFIVDTGATRVALTRADAARIGIAAADSEFTETARGASGPVRFKAVMLDRLTLGAIEARGVESAVVQSDMPVSLLGQSFLNTVGTVAISGNRMTLR